MKADPEPDPVAEEDHEYLMKIALDLISFYKGGDPFGISSYADDRDVDAAIQLIAKSGLLLG